MHWYVYETTNLVNNKTYIGVHKGSFDDEYLGSGTYFQRALNKYGRENFYKLPIFVGRSKEITYWIERMLVDEDHIKDKNNYNIKLGGHGGFDFINSLKRTWKPTITEEYREKSRKGGLICVEKKLGVIGLSKKELRKNGQKGQRRKQELHPNWKHSEESLRKQKETFKKINHSKGPKNSQYGTIWITNGSENRKIKKDTSIPKGWKRGRILKKETNAP